MSESPVGTLASKAKGRVHVLQHVVHFRVVDLASGTGVVFRPDPDELVQVVCPEDGGVSRQVVKVVHNHSHEQIEHEEATEKDEGDKVSVGEVGAASFLRVENFPIKNDSPRPGGDIPPVSHGVTGSAALVEEKLNLKLEEAQEEEQVEAEAGFKCVVAAGYLAAEHDVGPRLPRGTPAQPR